MMTRRRGPAFAEAEDEDDFWDLLSNVERGGGAEVRVAYVGERWHLFEVAGHHRD